MTYDELVTFAETLLEKGYDSKQYGPHADCYLKAGIEMHNLLHLVVIMKSYISLCEKGVAGDATIMDKSLLEAAYAYLKRSLDRMWEKPLEDINEETQEG